MPASQINETLRAKESRPSVFIAPQQDEDIKPIAVAKKQDGTIVVRFLYYALLQPEDDFIIRYRKAWIAVSFPLQCSFLLLPLVV